MFGKLFGGGLKKSVPAPAPVAAPPPKAKKLVRLPESDDEWRRLRLTDSLAEQSLCLAAYLNPRRPSFNDPLKEKLKQARIDLRDPAPGDDAVTEDMGGGGFTVTPSKQHVMKPTTLDGLKAEQESIVILFAEDDGGSESEGVLVFHPTLGGIGLLPATEHGLFNDLLLNLVLRTGHYGRCKARVEDEKGEPVVRLDLTRYEVCYNRCQQVLHELGAGAQYTAE